MPHQAVIQSHILECSCACECVRRSGACEKYCSRSSDERMSLIGDEASENLECFSPVPEGQCSSGEARRSGDCKVLADRYRPRVGGMNLQFGNRAREAVVHYCIRG